MYFELSSKQYFEILITRKAMIRLVCFISLIIGFSITIYSQEKLDVQGKVKIGTMDNVTSGDSIVIWKSDGTLAVRNASTLIEKSPWHLGKDTLGGIVFYIYTGADGLEHGLIVDTTESSARWQSTISKTNGTRSWDGAFNTIQMTSSPAKDSITARSAILAGDWYLPSIDELNLLWQNRYHTNNALNAKGHKVISSTTAYWSSTEHVDNFAWHFDFFKGQADGNLKTNIGVVRAVRAF